MTDVLTTGAFVLFVVTGAGQVSTAYFPTKAMCDDAASVALTGVTVAEKKQRENDKKAEDEKQREQWREKHPPRPPKNEFERKMIKDKTASWFTPGDPGTIFGSSGGGSVDHATPDGLVQEGYPSWPDPVIWTANQSAITTARCFRND